MILSANTSILWYYDRKKNTNKISFRFRGSVLLLEFSSDVLQTNIGSTLLMNHFSRLRYCHYVKLRVLKRLGFTPPFVRRASYLRANLSENCYAPSRVPQD
jgi:hypothetical protein